ncbi:MAG: C25 family cysteine peptidase [Candidatus Woesearchaeota archaeon]
MGREIIALIVAILLSLSVVVIAAEEENSITGFFGRLPFFRNMFLPLKEATAEIQKETTTKESSDTAPVPKPEVEYESTPPAVEYPATAVGKDDSKYYAKQIFIVSDKDWRDVMGIVPVAMWHEGTTLNKYPVLIYHEEDASFDADAVIFFIQQYDPKELVIVGDTPEELDNLLIAEGYDFRPELTSPTTMVTGSFISEIKLKQPRLTETPEIDISPDWMIRISPEDYVDYWDDFDTVIVCEDNYQLGLLASVYASYMNVPLVFEGHRSHVDLRGKNVITIGRTSVSGSESYTTIEQLERRIIEKMSYLEPHPDKIILVNPNDLTIKEEGEYPLFHKSLLTRQDIHEIYSKASLASPFLAVAKNELIITTTSTDYSSVDSFLESKISSLSFSPKYLTIIASPPAIPMSKLMEMRTEEYEEVDQHFYGDIDSDGHQDIAVGRIFSMTASDVSSYVARDIFIEYLRPTNDFASCYQLTFLDQWHDAKSTQRAMSEAGFTDQSLYGVEGSISPDPLECMTGKVLSAYFGHSNSAGWTPILRSNLVNFKSSMFLNWGCSSCSYEISAEEWHPLDLFCANMIKHGSLAYMGAVDTVEPYGLKMNTIIASELIRGKDVGHAFLSFKKVSEAFKSMYTMAYRPAGVTTNYDRYFVLIGDPTIKILPTSSFFEETEFSIEEMKNPAQTKKVIIEIDQPSESSHYENTCEGGTALQCSPGNSDYYINPSSATTHVGGMRLIRSEDSDEQKLGDVLYWEIGPYNINAVRFKVTYSDGMGDSFALDKEGELYYKEFDDMRVNLLPVRVGDKTLVIMEHSRDNFNIGKILPSYSYEIEFDTGGSP